MALAPHDAPRSSAGDALDPRVEQRTIPRIVSVRLPRAICLIICALAWIGGSADGARAEPPAPGAPPAPAPPAAAPTAPTTAPPAPATAEPAATVPRKLATPLTGEPSTEMAGENFATFMIPCAPGNLVSKSRVTAPGAVSMHHRVRDGWLATEGSDWQSPYALTIPDTKSSIHFDLGAPRDVKYLVLQGDNNDVYPVEGSLDGITYHAMWNAPDVPDQGLRTRWTALPKVDRVRHLRVQARGGDGFYSVSEVRAYCVKPTPWPPKLTEKPRRPGLLGVWDWLDNDKMVQIKGALAALGALCLLLLSFPLRRTWFASRWWRDTAFLLAGPVVLTWTWIRHAELTTVQGQISTGVGCALVGVWLIVRWTSGPAESPRRWLGPVVQGLKRSGSLWVLALVGEGAAGYAWYRLGWLPALGVAGATLLAIGYLAWLARPASFRHTAALVLALLGLTCFASWWNLGHFHFNHYIHIWEHYHYYMGAKYGPELRYARLYECTAAADLADGLRTRVQKRKMRDLATNNELGTTDKIVADPTHCTSHFTPARWEAFRKDIRFFRGRFSRDRWDQSQTDHGYNGTPVWAIAGRLITDYGGELNWDKIVRIALVDSILLGLMWLVVWWAFGWEATCVALLWWGTNFPARFYWNGGSFLRYDWLVWLVVGLCLLKKDKPLLAGVALTYTTLLRIFPGFVVATLVLKALTRMVRERRFVLSHEHQRFALGCILAMGVMIPGSSWATGGLDAWKEFAQNSEKHLATALTNNMGLKTVLGFDWTTRARVMRNDTLEDPFGEWKDAREYFYHKRGPILLGLLILFCLMLGRAADREPDWAAACLGTGFILLASELTCYYWGFLLGYGLLWKRRRLPGFAATLLSAVTCWVSLIAWNDEHFALMSLLSALVVIGTTAHVAFGKAPQEATVAPVSTRAPPVAPVRQGVAPGLASP